MKMKFHRLAILIFCLPWMPAPAAPLAVGDALPALVAKDQFGKDFTLNTNIQFLLVVTEMACAKAANKKLAEQGAGFLELHHAACLMDIHAMPAVARFFALPKMRKYPHRIGLVDSAGTLAGFPVQPGRVTVLALTPTGHIQAISYWNPASEPVAGCFQPSPVLRQALTNGCVQCKKIIIAVKDVKLE